MAESTMGTKNHKCRDCGRQFVQNPTNRPVSEETKKLIDKLLLERLAIAAISRVSGISETWIQGYVNGKCRTVEKKAVGSVKKKGLSPSNVMRCGHM